MRIYLDMRCLKRPFDDQTQVRIRVETEAFLVILAAVATGRVEAVRSSAHDLENQQNPDLRRAAAVRAWLQGLNPPETVPNPLVIRAEELRGLGLRALDALHVAWAEYCTVDRFLTCDDRLLKRRDRGIIRVDVQNPVDLLPELA